MISRKVAFSILLGVVGVLVMTWRIGRFPAHVVVINQSGTPLTGVAIDTGANRFDLGSLRNGETRRISVDPSSTLRLIFHTTAVHVWSATEPLTAGQSLVLYITPELRVLPRSRIGTYAR